MATHTSRVLLLFTMSTIAAAFALAPPPLCSHKGLPATHQRGVLRQGSGITVAMGPNASAWGDECATQCCAAGPAKCRFWSVAPLAGAASAGVCTLLARCVTNDRRNLHFTGLG
jgi:hypothetical protein